MFFGGRKKASNSELSYLWRTVVGSTIADLGAIIFRWGGHSGFQAYFLKRHSERLPT